MNFQSSKSKYFIFCRLTEIFQSQAMMRSACQRLQIVCNHVRPSKTYGGVSIIQTRSKTLSIDNMNPYVKSMEYAVRGPIVIRAAEIEQELKSVSL